MERNAGCELGMLIIQSMIGYIIFFVLDLGWLNKSVINLTAVNQAVKKLLISRELKDEYRTAWLLKAITFIDLTTLAGDDTSCNVSRLCFKVMIFPLQPTQDSS